MLRTKATHSSLSNACIRFSFWSLIWCRTNLKLQSIREKEDLVKQTLLFLPFILQFVRTHEALYLSFTWLVRNVRATNEPIQLVKSNINVPASFRFRCPTSLKALRQIPDSFSALWNPSANLKQTGFWFILALLGQVQRHSKTTALLFRDHRNS